MDFYEYARKTIRGDSEMYLLPFCYNIEPVNNGSPKPQKHMSAAFTVLQYYCGTTFSLNRNIQKIRPLSSYLSTTLQAHFFQCRIYGKESSTIKA